jgi:hypothetical protein
MMFYKLNYELHPIIHLYCLILLFCLWFGCFVFLLCRVKYTKCQYVMYDILYVLNAHVVVLIHAKSLMAACLLAMQT